MSLLSATWQPLVSTGDFLEPPLAQLHKVFYRKLSAGLEGSASLAALHSDHLLLSKAVGCITGKCKQVVKGIHS